MQVNTQLDVDVVALEEAGEVTVLLVLIAPEAQSDTPRLPATLQIVLDRSGSMHGERLAAALGALHELVDRLSPDDRLGVVTFDDRVEVPLPCAPIGDGVRAHDALRGISPRGGTNLSSGLLRGLQEARRAQGEDGATLLLLSDGHANAGVVDEAQLAAVARSAAGDGVAVTTVGVGLDYGESLLAAIAAGGRGNHTFAEGADDAANAVAGEVDGLLERTVQAASLTIRPESEVDAFRLWHDLPTIEVDSGVVAELGDLWAGETRKLVLTSSVPAKATLGLARVAQLELRSVAVPSLVEQTVSLDVHVNVVPGDQAAGRIPDPIVRTQLLVQQAADAKREAAERIADGDVQAARQILGDAAEALADAGVAGAPLADIAELQRDTEMDLRRAAKKALMQYHRQSRKSGRDDGPRE